MIATVVQQLRNQARRPLGAVDAAMNGLYGWRYNPLAAPSADPVQP